MNMGNTRIKRSLFRYMCIIQITALFISLGSIGPLGTQLAFAEVSCNKPSPSSSTGPNSYTMGNNQGKCTSICPSTPPPEASTTSSSGSSKVTSVCGPSPTPGSADSSITSNGVTYENYGACSLDTLTRYGQVDNYCKAMNLADTSMWYGLAAASAYTATAVSCFALCAVTWLDDWSPFTPAIKAAAAVCSGLGLVATGIDVAGMIHVNVTGAADLKSSVAAGGYQEWWAAQLGTGVASSVVGSAGSAAGVTAGVLTMKQGFASASTAGAYASCIASGIFAVSAALKWANMGVSLSTANDICCAVESLPGFGAYTPAPLESATPNSSGAAPSGGGGGGASASGGATSSSALSNAGIDKMLKGNDHAFPSGMLSAATEGPMSKLLNSMDNKDQLPDLLQQAGMGLKDIAKKLASGQSPASVISSALPNLPSDLANALKANEKAALDGTLSFPGMPNSAMASGGSGGAKATSSGDPVANRFSAFGARGIASDTGAKDLSFGATKAATSSASDDNDIWHSKWNGSIFQLITNKLYKNQNRVEQLEWSTPLNRALMGISNKPAQKGSGK